MIVPKRLIYDRAENTTAICQDGVVLGNLINKQKVQHAEKKGLVHHAVSSKPHPDQHCPFGIHLFLDATHKYCRQERK